MNFIGIWLWITAAMADVNSGQNNIGFVIAVVGTNVQLAWNINLACVHS